MDALDIRILRELTQAQSVLPARPGLGSPYREIAKRLRISAGTARNRIKNMYHSGVLTGTSAYANPRLLGLEVGAYALDVSNSLPKQDVIEKLKLIEGMLFIQNFHGSMIGLAFAYENQRNLQRKLALFKGIAGTADGVFSQVEYPTCTSASALSFLDWMLIARLTRGDGFRSYSQLAREMRISVRTLKRRLARLVTTRALLSVPTMDYRAITGSVPADVLVSFTSREQRVDAEKKILELLGEVMIYAGAWADFGLYSTILAKIVTATELVERIRKIHGVGLARVEFVYEHIDQARTLSEYVERRIAILKESGYYSPNRKLLPNREQVQEQQQLQTAAAIIPSRN
ncbi:MAG TPA: hypothetical protein VFF30_01605 [Nitrososphaerales archaeon]|nr:hypothetical protein [Nitrososphaerales archaeon]